MTEQERLANNVSAISGSFHSHHRYDDFVAEEQKSRPDHWSECAKIGKILTDVESQLGNPDYNYDSAIDEIVDAMYDRDDRTWEEVCEDAIEDHLW